MGEIGRRCSRQGGAPATCPSLQLQFIRLLLALQFRFRSFRSGISGMGGFGTVYKGWVDEKSLQPSKQRTGDGCDQQVESPEHEGLSRMAGNSYSFVCVNLGVYMESESEVNFLGRLTHPNLVKLLGYCWEDGEELLLVYEFMQNGSLESYLFSPCAFTNSLPWDIRLKIAIGAAKGLAFMNASDRNYRDFKASNILLDGSFNAKISDLWLAELEPCGGNATLKIPIGAANEMAFLDASYSIYQRTGHLKEKSDVYGFGVVLLELLTGSRGHDTQRAQQNLVDWMKPLLSQKRKLKTIMDARLQGQYSSKAAAQAAQLTLRCLEQEPRKRPPMKEVAEILEQIAAMEKPRVSNIKEEPKRPR
ncbi:probable serine/threonine-protein kinase PIX13 isoform X3 [Salvia hispanica]|uniref:probable serine/threonine-protein kinase PIX13 isoform X3 n=1 Tax=Salvia hispanica TaxID=49212 RepID=UPI002009835A|nr:probable serine/threonine-protein kinase PIX13 isoform X3 [Salvia hispanica]